MPNNQCPSNDPSTPGRRQPQHAGAVDLRPFRRSDRDQLTALVNGHVAAVLPGATLSANVVLNQLEREPEESIVDPWVAERLCLVAEVEQAVVAAILLHRFDSTPAVNEGYRSAARVRWLLFTPGHEQAARQLLDHAVEQAERWNPSSLFVESALPAPGCIGVSAAWPHVAQLLADAGFVGPTRIETVLAADCRELAATNTDAITTRSVGVLGTRLDLLGEDGRSRGYIEVAPAGAALQRSSTSAAWADIGNLFPAPDHSLDEVMAPLIAAAARWLELGGIDRLIDYYAPDVHEPRYRELLDELGFVELTVNQRFWER